VYLFLFTVFFFSLFYFILSSLYNWKFVIIVMVLVY